MRSTQNAIVSSKISKNQRINLNSSYQYLALDDTTLIEMRSFMTDLIVHHIEVEAEEIFDTPRFSSPLARKKNMINLPGDQFAFFSADKVTVFCSKTREPLQSISLPFECKGESIAVDINRVKLSFDANIILVNLCREFDLEEKVYGKVRHLQEFAFLIDLVTQKVLRIPLDRNISDISFVSSSRIAVVLNDARGIKFYDFNISQNNYHAVNLTTELPDKIEKLWVWPHRPSTWLTAERNNDCYNLNVYSVKESKESYLPTLLNKVGEAAYHQLDKSVMNFNSLIFTSKDLSVMEFNLITLQTHELTYAGVALMRPLCIFPDGDIGMLGIRSIGTENSHACLVVSKLQSVCDYEKECQEKVIEAIDNTLMKDKIHVPFPLLGIVAQYAVEPLGLRFFSAKPVVSTPVETHRSCYRKN